MQCQEGRSEIAVSPRKQWARGKIHPSLSAAPHVPPFSMSAMPRVLQAEVSLCTAFLNDCNEGQAVELPRNGSLLMVSHPKLTQLELSAADFPPILVGYSASGRGISRDLGDGRRTMRRAR